MRLRGLRFAALLVPVLLLAHMSLSPVRAQVDNELAQLILGGMRLHSQGKFAEGVALAERSVTLARGRYGEDSMEFATAASLLGMLYQAQGRYAEAEPLQLRALAIYERRLGPGHTVVTTPLNALASLYVDQGRYAKAEPLYKRSLAIKERTLGPDDGSVATSLNNLAHLYVQEGRYAEAEPLYKRSLAIRESALARSPPPAGTGKVFEDLARISRNYDRDAVPRALNNLAELYAEQGRYADAEPLFRRSLAMDEAALGRDHPTVATTLSNLAGLYMSQGRDADAEPLLKRGLAIREKALGPGHLDVAMSLNNLATLYRKQSRYADAEALLTRSFAIFASALGREHPSVATSLGNLAVVAFAQRDWGKAADYWRRAIAVIERRTLRNLAGTAEGSSKGEAQRSSGDFVGLVKTTWRLTAEGRASGPLAADTFETAQWVQASEAAASLAKMAARSAAGSSDLAGLVRERQDLAVEWQAKDKLLIAAKGQEPGKRNGNAEKALADRLDAIDARLAEIGRTLAKDFPDYAALISPAPVPVAEVQGELGSDEALVLFLTTNRFESLPEETFIWVVTRSEVRWVRSPLGTAALGREVVALRCGLDDTLWDDAANAKACTSILDGRGRTDIGSNASVLPFDLQRAHALYKSLFGEVEDLVAGKHLLIVPSGALTQLPFQVLVTEPPATPSPRAAPSPTAPHPGPLPASGERGSPFAAYREAAWLGTRQPITVLPAVSSLKALRASARPSRAAKAYLGFGNPLLDGNSKDAGDVGRAQLAREKQRCRPASPQRVAALDGSHRGAAPAATRGGLADIRDIRFQAPLPETADELCAVAQNLRADTAEIRLGARATEAEIKRLSTSGELAKYRVLHFATHGAMAGQLEKDREPGLILTPPDKATDLDDGYLSASEIAALKLDADWVILSACNTAAGGASSAEALSGVARAFFYAGARALLVSHWAVDSDATVKLVTRAVAEMAGDRTVGRAEAMRRAMAALIETGAAYEAHPSYWAPFVVVGEGAAASRR
jgi:CHAT domain-containing protein/tetratricopeptide (TPR) repeat protein